MASLKKLRKTKSIAETEEFIANKWYDLKFYPILMEGSEAVEKIALHARDITRSKNMASIMDKKLKLISREVCSSAFHK